MQLETNLYQDNQWQKEFDTTLDSPNTLVIVFGAPSFPNLEKALGELSEKFPHSIITGCSSSGEIYEGRLYDGTLSVAICQFEKTKIVINYAQITDLSSSLTQNLKSSFQIGAELTNSFEKTNLKSLYVLADGIRVNGSELVKGMNKTIGKEVIITGGMASDHGNFQGTWVLVEGKAKPNYVSVVGFYGDSIQTNYTSEGGWSRIGLHRLITSCDTSTNTIYTINNQPILEIYKSYMGEQAKNLPASGLEFPILVIDDDDDIKIRSLLSADEDKQSITVYGDIKKGDKIVFLKGNPNNIITGAQKAVKKLTTSPSTPTLALTVSCIGRRAVLKERSEDEVEIVKETLNETVSQIGFYSYGEISPQASGKCGLLNQTMTLALIWES